MNTRNYGLSNARPKLLTLGDFFRLGADYRAATMPKVPAKLNDQGANFVVDGTVKKLETAQLNNFMAEPDGLKWIFSPYDVAPCAAGVAEAKLKISELGPNFRRELRKK